MPSNTEHSEHSEHDPEGLSRLQALKEVLVAASLKTESYAAWLGGVAVGNYAVRHEDLNAWAAGAAVALGVTAVELATSTAANRHISKTKSDTSGVFRSTARKAALRYAGAAWYGAGVQTAIDKKTTGEEVSLPTRLSYSATYGTAVGAWVAPVPGFEHAVDGMIAYGRFSLDHPYMLPAPAVVAGSYALVKRRRGSSQAGSDQANDETA